MFFGTETRLQPQVARDESTLERRHYDLGSAHIYLEKAGGAAATVHALSGRLHLSASGWLLLSVPNALGQGAFDALNEPGVELPTSNSNGRYNAHITVMSADEVAKIGGPDVVSERGHSFSYTLGPVKEVEPDGQSGISKVWLIEVSSNALKNLRKSYGLPPLPHNNEHPFHITIGERRRNILRNNDVSKAASQEDRYDACELLLSLLSVQGVSLEKQARPGGSPANTFQVNPDGLPLPVPVAMLGGSTLLGSLLASDTGSPVADKTRGAMKGLGAGAGGLGGLLLARSLDQGAMGQSVGAGIGGLTGWLAANQLAKLLNLDRQGGVGPLAREDDAESKAVVGDLAGQKRAEDQPASSPSVSIIPQLLEAKMESDRKNYLRKHLLMRQLMRQRPDEFVVDSDRGDGIVGVTHSGSGFRMHLPANVLPAKQPTATGATK